MAADVRLCVLSLSARSPEGSDAAYLEWHLLDHLPEQYGIDALQHGQRWVSTPACRAARPAGGDDALAAADHVVQYLFAEPTGPALDRFFALGGELHGAGRMPLRLPPVELGAYELVHRRTSASALVDPRVLPWRPCRGAYLVIEQGAGDDDGDELCDLDGVAGTWRYRGGTFHDRLADTSGRHLTVCYLDGDPVEVAARLGDALAGRHLLLAAPFVSVVPWDWERSLP